MTKNDIKGIPQCVRAEIRRVDKKYRELVERNITRFYYYVGELKNGEIAKYTVAAKENPTTKKLMIKQVAVRDKVKTYANDMMYGYICGYQVEWDKDIETGRQHVDWEDVTKDTIPWNPSGVVINTASLENTKYKYSGYQYVKDVDLYEYLQIWEQHKGVEYLAKNDMSYLITKKRIIKKCESDKNFMRFLKDNKSYFINNKPYYQAIIKSYELNLSLEMMDVYYGLRNRYNSIFDNIKPQEIEKTINYIINSCKGNFSSYNDYLNACVMIGLNMNDTKNKYPRDFQRWHDIRIDQYNSQKDKHLNIKFNAVVKKYINLETNNDFIVIIARSKNDLINEGNVLHHCVGKMNYDERIVKEQSLIFFVREDKDTPFVTIEYSLKSKKVLQCYGDHDSRPEQRVLDFVYNKWQPFANRQLNKIKKAA